MKKWLLLLLALILCTMPAASCEGIFPGMLVYEPGQYKVGRDMRPGEYVLLCTDSYSGYFCVSSDALKRDIICNDLFEVNSILTVEYGEYVELSRCLAISSVDFYSEYTIKTSNSGIMLRVGYGYDLMPGEYRLRADAGEMGYFCIYNDSRQTDIVDNDLFENTTYVTLRSGQYIKLSRCKLFE